MATKSTKPRPAKKTPTKKAKAKKAAPKKRTRAKAKGSNIPPMPPGGERFGAWFDAEAADLACEFFSKHLRHTEAEWAGKPFELAQWQRDRIIRPLFGWKRADGTRLIRTVYLEVPRKNGKTELAAGVSILALLADGEVGGQAYSMAVDKDQAKIVFNKAGVMVGYSDTLRDELEIFKTSIYCPALMAAFKPLSSSPNTKHGFHPSVAIADEIHVWNDGELYQVVHDGMAGRAQPIELLITTAGIARVGFGWEQHVYAEKVLSGEVEDPTFLPVIFGVAADADWTDEKQWAIANPNLGVSPKLDFLRQQCTRAKESVRKENNFRRYHLNQWTEQSERWLSIAAWDECGEAVDPDSLLGRECYGGLDLSRKIDISAFVLVFPPAEEGERWKILCYFWVPKERIDLRVKNDRVPYDQWVADGFITATAGNVVDYRVIFNDIAGNPALGIVGLGSKYVIREVGFDPWNATQLANELIDDGFEMVEMRQGMRTLSEPMKRVEEMVLEAQFAHGANPVLRWMAGNVAVRMDANENIMPDKEKSTERIDGMAALINAMGRAMFHGDGETEITYQRGEMFS